jgi:iron complex transport system ATP-binding protein
MRSPRALLATRGAGFTVASKALISDVDLTIGEGELVALIGPNGSGKTTLLRLLTGVLTPTSGEILLEGKPLPSYSRPEVACHMAYLPQNTWTEFDLTVFDAVSMGRFPHTGAWRSPTATDREAIHAAMEQVGVHDLTSRTLPTLSAGERQRVFIARALAQGSPLLVLDEPTSSLDIGHQMELVEILRHLHFEGKTVVVAIHDLRLAWEQFPRAVLLDRGHLTADGPCRDVIRSGAASDAFGIDVAADGSLVFTRRTGVVTGTT